MKFALSLLIAAALVAPPAEASEWRWSYQGGGVTASGAFTTKDAPDADGFYEAWLHAHEGLTEAESHDLDARLVLLLANQVGEQQVLLRCIEAARAVAKSSSGK